MHIVLTENCTADGVIDMAAGWFVPADQTDDQLVAATQAHMVEQDALLLGPQHLREPPGATGRSRPTTPPASPTT